MFVPAEWAQTYEISAKTLCRVGTNISPHSPTYLCQLGKILTKNHPEKLACSPPAVQVAQLLHTTLFPAKSGGGA
eukprot:1272312-Prymnesium_polylepis.2